MATLNELNQLSNEISRTDREAESARSRSKRLADLRKNNTSILEFIKPNPYSSHPDPTEVMVRDVIEEFRSDLIRVVELRQDAKAREFTAKASVLRMSLSAAVDAESVEDAS